MYRFHLLLSTFFLLLKIPSLHSLNCSITVFGGPAEKDLPCVFPFKYLGKTYERCTTAYDVDGRPWCATSVLGESRELTSGSEHWGYCDPDCPYVDFYGDLFSNNNEENRDYDLEKTDVKEEEKEEKRVLDDSSPISERTRISSTSPSTPLDLTKLSKNSSSGTWIPSGPYCGQSISLGFILGGVNANLGEFPFAVLLGYKSFSSRREYDYLCGGALINRRYVLTAAHCHTENSPLESLVLGELDVEHDPDCNSGCKPVQIFNSGLLVKRHPFYRFENNLAVNDIALIRLPELAATIEEDLSTFVSPICLPLHVESMANHVGEDLMVVGWGKTSEDNRGLANQGIGSSILQKLSFKGVSQENCLKYFRGIKETHICAGGKEGKDSCGGDSGSPLFTSPKSGSPMTLVGLVSFGTHICGIGAPGVYTRVDTYMDWIIANLEP